MKTHLNHITFGTQTKIHRLEGNTRHSQTKARCKRRAKKHARQALKHEMEEILEEDEEIRRDAQEQDEEIFNQMLDDLNLAMAMEGRIEYEDEMVARWSEEDYPSGCPEHMDPDDYANYTEEHKVWD